MHFFLVRTKVEFVYVVDGFLLFHINHIARAKWQRFLQNVQNVGPKKRLRECWVLSLQKETMTTAKYIS